MRRLSGPDELARRLSLRLWRLMAYEPAPGAWNMALDAALLAAAAAGGPPTLRFYGWGPPAVSVGRFQDPGRGIDWEYCRRRRWEGVRRPTGGRAVLHHQELTYSLVLPPDLVGGATLTESCSVFRAGLTTALEECLGRSLAAGCSDPTMKRALREGGEDAGRTMLRTELGGGEAATELPHSRFGDPNVVHQNLECGNSVAASPSLRARTRAAAAVRPANCFAQVAGGDIATGAGKLVGSAQARTGGALLQHGSLLLAVERPAWEALFGDPGALMAVEEMIRPVPQPAALAEALAEALARAWGIEFNGEALSPQEREAARANTARYDLGLTG